MSRLLLVLALLAGATPARATAALPKDELTVVTLNLWNEEGDWPKRLPVIVAGLRALHPDVVCLQEVLQHPGLPNQAQTLADSLGMAMQFASVDGPERPKRFGNAILTPHPVLRVDAVNLRPYDDWRAAAHVRLAWRGHTIDVYDTHLHYTAGGGAIRARQVRDLLAFVDSTRAADGAVVLAGDFNCETGAPELDALWPDHVDAYRALHPSAPRADAVTYNARFGEDPGAIDHVFARAVAPRALVPIECRVLFREPRPDSVWVSDHFGLLARLMVAGGNAPAARAPAAPAPLDSADVRRWSDDLEFLAREMPRQHASLFHAMRREQFDSARVHIAAWLPVMSRSDAIVSLMRLAALVGDGHTNVAPWRDTVIAFHTLPVALHRFADGWYVRAAARAQAALLGARITAIGGVPIDSAMARVAPLIGRDNAMGARQYAPWLLAMPEVLRAVRLAPDERHASLTFENGRSGQVTLAATQRFPNLGGDNDRSWQLRDGWIDARDGARAPLWLSRDDAYWFTAVPDAKLLYCQVNEIQEKGEPFDAFMARALYAADSLGAERFVLDLRRCGGGNAQYNRAIVRALVRSRFDARGRLFVVTGRRTFSAAGMLCCDLEHWSQPIFVGEPGASRGNHYGDSKKLVMPNSQVTLRVSTLYWQFWDPRDTREWIAPEIAAPLTFADYRAGRDPALDAIARYAPQPDLVDVLRPLLANGDRVAATRTLEQYERDPAHAWIDVAGALETLAGEFRWNGNEPSAALADTLRAAAPPWRMPD